MPQHWSAGAQLLSSRAAHPQTSCPECRPDPASSAYARGSPADREGGWWQVYVTHPSLLDSHACLRQGRCEHSKSPSQTIWRVAACVKVWWPSGQERGSRRGCAAGTDQQQRKQEHDDAVADVAKHDGKEEGEGDDGEDGRVGLAVARDACGQVAPTGSRSAGNRETTASSTQATVHAVATPQPARKSTLAGPSSIPCLMPQRSKGMPDQQHHQPHSCATHHRRPQCPGMPRSLGWSGRRWAAARTSPAAGRRCPLGRQRARRQTAARPGRREGGGRRAWVGSRGGSAGRQERRQCAARPGRGKGAGAWVSSQNSSAGRQERRRCTARPGRGKGGRRAGVGSRGGGAGRQERRRAARREHKGRAVWPRCAAQGIADLRAVRTLRDPCGSASHARPRWPHLACHPPAPAPARAPWPPPAPRPQPPAPCASRPRSACSGCGRCPSRAAPAVPGRAGEARRVRV